MNWVTRSRVRSSLVQSSNAPGSITAEPWWAWGAAPGSSHHPTWEGASEQHNAYRVLPLVQLCKERLHLVSRVSRQKQPNPLGSSNLLEAVNDADSRQPLVNRSRAVSPLSTLPRRQAVAAHTRGIAMLDLGETCDNVNQEAPLSSEGEPRLGWRCSNSRGPKELLGNLQHTFRLTGTAV